ncbi:hypothetical protein DZK27_08815 [Rhodobacteraceae bacterium 63075]|nr:hypothetical protein DZK27_08815 [Rhodobacteraceae bacterium 63075]
MVFLALSALGVLVALSLFVPLVFNPDWVPLRIVNHSIDYTARLIWESIVSYGLFGSSTPASFACLCSCRLINISRFSAS